MSSGRWSGADGHKCVHDNILYPELSLAGTTTLDREWHDGYQAARPADNSDRDKLARKRGQVGP